jgi:hypothetical protein
MWNTSWKAAPCGSVDWTASVYVVSVANALPVLVTVPPELTVKLGEFTSLFVTSE